MTTKTASLGFKVIGFRGVPDLKPPPEIPRVKATIGLYTLEKEPIGGQTWEIDLYDIGDAMYACDDVVWMAEGGNINGIWYIGIRAPSFMPDGYIMFIEMTETPYSITAGNSITFAWNGPVLTITGVG